MNFRWSIATGSTIPWSAEKSNSRKFKVASDPSSSAPSTRVRHGGASSEFERRDLVAFGAPVCIKGLRLVTTQLPEKSPPIGPGLNRTSPIWRSEKFGLNGGTLDSLGGIVTMDTWERNKLKCRG
jgi:hypothetical protein